MSWITIVWSMNAGACFVLAGVCFVVWCKQRESWPHLLFSCSAVAAAVIALIELAMLHGNTVGRYAELIRWIHVPVWVLTLSFVAFVRLYLRAGRRWLAWSIYGLRTLVLILNFILTPNINFRAITSIRHFSWWGGEIVSVPVGMPNPWGLLSNVSLLLLLIFSVDAAITVWRRGDRRRALVVGGSMILGAIVAWHVPLVIWGVIDVPFFLSFAYSGIVLAMGYELSNDMLQTAQLAQKLEVSDADLRETQERMELAASAAELGMWMWDIVRNEIWITDKGRALFGFAPSEKLDFDRVSEAGCILTIVNRCSGLWRTLCAPAQNIDVSTGCCYRMDNCTGSPGAATLSSTVPVGRFECAELHSTLLSASRPKSRRGVSAMRWRISRGFPRWANFLARLRTSSTCRSARFSATRKLHSESSRMAMPTLPRCAKSLMTS